MGSTIAGRVHN